MAEKERKKKNRSDGFLPDPEKKMPKKQQNNSKNQKTPSQLFSSQNRLGKAEKKKKEKNRSGEFLPDPEQKTPKKKEKNLKKKKKTL